MNQNITNLAEQAAEAVVAYEHDVMLRVENAEGAVLEIPADFIYKFAELIVRECASLFDGTKETKTVGMLTHNQIVEQIVKHFGVEE